MRQRRFFGCFTAKALHAAGDHVQHWVGHGTDTAVDLQLVDQPLHNAAQRAGFAVSDVVGATGDQLIAVRLAGQPHGVNGVFVVGHIHKGIAAARQQHAAVMVHHLRQTRNKYLIVRPEQALRTQDRKAGVRV